MASGAPVHQQRLENTQVKHTASAETGGSLQTGKVQILRTISPAKELIFTEKKPAVLDRKISDVPWSSTSLCVSHMLGLQIAPPDH